MTMRKMALDIGPAGAKKSVAVPFINLCVITAADMSKPQRGVLRIGVALKGGHFPAGLNVPEVNDAVEAKDSNVARQMASKNLEMATSRAVPDWLSLNKEACKGTVVRIPTRDDIHPVANEQAVVEFYSR